jgi:poly-gamma-glutamate synthesis protein (capsule biosynthesis protein)
MIVAIAATTACKRQQEKPRDAELWFGGDVNLGDGGNGQLRNISGMVQGAVGIVNLEGPVARGAAARKFRLWNSPQALSELYAINVRVAGIANNHAQNFGADGQQQTARALNEHGILATGGPSGAALLNVSGLSIAITAHDLTNGVPAKLEGDLANARKAADVLVATFHVTGPVSYLPRPELKRAVEIAYHAGAKLIVAHGTHAMGPVERRGDTVIAWGLGNVAFACDCTDEEDAILLRVHVQQGSVTSAEVLPLQAGLNKRPAQPGQDPGGVFDLLEAIGSSKLTRKDNAASF